MISAKFSADMDEVVDTEPLGLLLLAPKLGVLLCAESSPLLAPLAPPGITRGGPLLLFCVFSFGVWFVPIGVARLSLGGCLLELGIARGGSAEFSDIGGAAVLFTGLWLGEAGIASPNRGTLAPDCDLAPPGIGGRSSGAGEAISVRSGGSTLRLLESATLGAQIRARGCQRRRARLLDSLAAVPVG